MKLSLMKAIGARFPGPKKRRWIQMMLFCPPVCDPGMSQVCMSAAGMSINWRPEMCDRGPRGPAISFGARLTE
jgi:hypothetical protein